MKFESRNPFNDKLLQKFNLLKDRELEEALQKAEYAFAINRTSAIPVRTKRLLNLIRVLEERKEVAAALMTEEMGKPIQQAIAEVDKCIQLCQFYMDSTAEFLKDQQVETDAIKSSIYYAPLGLILGIMPWNFPFWQVFRFAIPALMTGNAVLLKHAPNVPRCAAFIEDLFVEAAWPDHLFQNLYISNEQVARVIEDDRIQGVSFTGSLKTGSIIGALAGSNIKKCILELGGSDAFVVLADANLKEAAHVAIASRMLNNGQSCIAAKRWIVDQVVAESFVSLVQEEISRLVVGDPKDPNTDVGPMARKDLALELHRQMEDSISQGARVLYGGGIRKSGTSMFEPTLLVDVEPGMPCFDEETFGPLATVIVAEDDQDAIMLANQSKYGLGASIWSTDRDRANILAKQLQCGTVTINGMVKSHVELPFGGIRNSGFGRELGQFGLMEFINIKTILSY